MRPNAAKLAEQITGILRSKDLTLHQVSQKTKTLYGRWSPYFVPHNLYYDLRVGSFSPSLHQLFTLSRISGYRFHDWLRVFGFDPADIVRLQILLPSKRSIVLDSTLEDPESWIPWFQNKPSIVPIPENVPLGRLLDPLPPTRLRSLIPAEEDANFVYVKVGREDALAFPDLHPGSIVRADARLARRTPPIDNEKKPGCFFLVEHGNGLSCCRLQAAGRDRIVLLGAEFPSAQLELLLQEEARVLGVLDLEIRPLLKPESAGVPRQSGKRWQRSKLAPEKTKLSQLLGHARRRIGLSFREASAMSHQIATRLGDEQYFAAPGSLSDYEAIDTPPRHVHKAITLCAVYGLHFSAFLESIGLDLEQAGREPIPDYFVPRAMPAAAHNRTRLIHEPKADGFLEQLLRRAGHVPFFLRASLSDLSGMKNPSVHDFFWVGGEQEPLHPLLKGGLVVIVNRHKKKPVSLPSMPLWQQPLYMLLRRDGTYVCASCSLENGSLLIHPYSSEFQRPDRLRNHYDAEVVGQVVTVVRRL